MKAVRLDAPGQIQVVERPLPEAEGAALVRVQTVGICGTDVKIRSGDIPVPYPLVVGHEMVGTVETPGPSGRIARGARVTVNPAVSCGHCDLCLRGYDNLCRNGGLLGRDVDGVCTEYVAVPEDRLHEVPTAVSADAAPLLQVLGTVVHAQRSVEPDATESAVVIGLGISGLLHLQMLLHRGFRTVIGVTRSAAKLEMASDLGATATATPAEADAVVARLTGGRGADVVIECVGTEATLTQSVELAGYHSDIVVFGTLTSGGTGLPYYQMYHKELTLHHPRAAIGADYEEAIALAAEGKLQLDALVNSRHCIDDAEAAFAAVGAPGIMKVAIDIDG